MRAFALALAGWVACAVALVWLRVPFDDEWFSIELALDATPSQLWYALEHDVHPIWLPLLDRALAQLWPSALSLQLLSIAISALAIALLANAFESSQPWLRWVVPLAALHPIVLFYGGAARWYPLLMLAHVLRLRGICRARPGELVAGAWLGFAAGYIDALFIVHDCLWFAWQGRGQWKKSLLVGSAALSCIPVLLPAAPFQPSPQAPLWRLQVSAGWALLGLGGEAGIGWLLLVGIASCALAVGYALLLQRSAALVHYVISYGACWLVATGFGISHPRYSLLLWLLLTLCVVRALPQTRPALRWNALVAALHLLVGVGLCFAGRGFVKADLNRLEPSDCMQLRAASLQTDALIVPYRRLAALVQRCLPNETTVSLRSVRVVSDEREQLAPVEARLAKPGAYGLIAIESQSSIAETQARVRARFALSCSASGEPWLFGELPHPQLSLGRPSTYRRFRYQRYSCQ